MDFHKHLNQWRYFGGDNPLWRFYCTFTFVWAFCFQRSTSKFNGAMDQKRKKKRKKNPTLSRALCLHDAAVFRMGPVEGWGLGAYIGFEALEEHVLGLRCKSFRFLWNTINSVTFYDLLMSQIFICLTFADPWSGTESRLYQDRFTRSSLLLGSA